jgi:hypothetical protein
LLERIFNGSCRCEYRIEAFLDELGHFQRVKGGFFDADGNAPQPAGRGRIRQQVIREYRVKIENRMAVKTDILRRADKKRDRVLVVEDHLRFQLVAAFRLLAELDQAPCIEQ